jgi:hypothetical protein
VLVPAAPRAGAGGDDDPLDSLAAAIAAEVERARSAAGRPVVVYADTTLDYGCLCPPFVFAPFWNSGRPDSYVLPVLAPGVADLPATKEGLFRMVGRFTGERITGFAWRQRRGETDRKEGMDEFARAAPVFRVEDWCFEPVPVYEDRAAEEIYGPALRAMAAAGRMCPGHTLPAPPP